MKNITINIIFLLCCLNITNLNAQLVISDSISNNACAGMCNGAIDISVSGGVLPYTYNWSNGASSEDLNGICDGTYNVTVSDSIASLSFDLPWTYTLTGDNHTVLIQSGIGLINSQALDSGDYIGAFFTDSTTQHCGGYILWPGSTTAVSVWGENPSSPVKDGFATGEAFIWKVWKANDGSIVDMTATYQFGPDTYILNGQSALASLNGTYTPLPPGSSITASYNLIPNTTMTIAADLSNYGGYGVSAYGMYDSYIDLTISGGTAPFSFVWSNSQTSEDLMNLAAGTYYVTVTDVNGCLLTDSFLITQPPPLSIDAVVISDYSGYGVSAIGASDGFIDITVSGGVPPISYLWSNGDTSEDLQNLAAGTYEVIVSDSSGAQVSQTFLITELVILPLTSSGIIINNLCNDSCNGSISLAVSGGTPPYSYEWSNGASSQDLAGLCDGNYSVTISDINATQPSLPWSYYITLQSHVVLIQTGVCSINGLPLDSGDYIGAFFTDNGTQHCGGYAQWLGASTAISIWGDDSGSSVKDGFVLGETINWKAWKASDGATIDLSSTYFFGPTTFEVNANSGLSSLTGSYTPQPPNSITETFTISSPPNFYHSFMLSNYGGYNISATGLSDGSIDITSYGGTAPHTYNWSSGQTSEDLNNIPAGEYQLSISDANGCMISDTFLMTEPIIPLSIDTAILSDYGGYGVSYLNAQDGFIQLTVSGGQAPLTYFWSNGATTEDLQFVPAGSYGITISDAFGNSLAASYTLTAPLFSAPLSITDSISPVQCYNMCNAAIDLNVTGGIPPYQYLWSNGSTSESIDSLCPGTYSCTVNDHLGQNIAALPWTYTNTGVNHSIAIPTGTVSVNGAPLDNGDVIGVFYDSLGTMACAGYVTWTGSTNIMAAWGTANIGGNPAGFSYLNEEISWKVWRAADGYIVDMLPAYDPALPNMNTYEANGMSALTSLTGYYNTSANQQTAIVSYNILNPDSIVIDTTLTLVDPVLNNGAINLTVAGGLPPYSYLWNTGAVTQNLNALHAGLYTVTLTDSAGCSVNREILLEQSYELPDLVISVDTISPTCPGSCDGTLNATVTGGLPPYEIQWLGHPAGADIDSLCTGSETLLVNDSYTGPYMTNWDYTVTNNVHTMSFSNTIIEGITLTSNYIDKLTVGAFYKKNGLLYCVGKSVSTNYLPPIKSFNAYADDPGTPEKDGFTPGDSIYWHCEVEFAWSTIYSGALRPQNMGASNQGSFLINGNTFFGGLETTLNYISLEYQLTDPDSIQVDYILSDYAGFNVSAYGANDGFIDLTVSGGTMPYLFNWSNGATTEDVNNLAAGNYQVTVTDINLCNGFVQSFELTSPAPAPISFSDTVINTFCWGSCFGSIEMNVSGGYLPYGFEWSNGDSTSLIENLCAGAYELTVTSDTNAYTFQYVVTQPDTLTLTSNVTPVDPTLTLDGAIDLTVSGGTPPYVYIWSDGTSSEDISAANYGTYSVFVTDIQGCEQSHETFVDLGYPIPWEVINTTTSHTIDIPFNASLSANGLAPEKYDLIAVFYDSLGTEKCGGYAVWQNVNTSIQSFGDDLSTTNIDGFATGESFVWKIYDFSMGTQTIVTPAYDLSYPDDLFFVAGGSSAITGLQSNSISGNVSTSSKAQLNLGMMVLYQQTPSGIGATYKGLIVDGNYQIDGLTPGSYLCYAIPQPGNDWGIPGYYTSRDNWEDGSWVQVNGHTSGIDITIDPVQPYTTGTASIGGNILVGVNSNYNPLIFGNEWFPASGSKSDAARNIPVLLYDDQNNPLDFRLSDEQGTFAYSNLEYGTYFVRVEQAGFSTDSIEVELSASNPNIDDLVFTIDSATVTGTAMLNFNNDVVIYPNPTSGRVNFILPENTGNNYAITLFDISGKLVKQFTSNNTQFTTDLSYMAKGVYYVKLSSQKWSATRKIVLE